jgi:hypothetical protein
MNLQIPDDQKALYIQALDILDEVWLDRVYATITNFVKQVEVKKVEELQQTNIQLVSWLRKKEAEEKKQDLNSFNFLISNI